MVRECERPFLKALWNARERKAKFRMTPEVEADLRDFFERSLKNLEIREQASEVMDRFLAMRYIEYFVKNEREKKKHRTQN